MPPYFVVPYEVNCRNRNPKMFRYRTVSLACCNSVPNDANVLFCQDRAVHLLTKTTTPVSVYVLLILFWCCPPQIGEAVIGFLTIVMSGVRPWKWRRTAKRSKNQSMNAIAFRKTILA